MEARTIPYRKHNFISSVRETSSGSLWKSSQGLCSFTSVASWLPEPSPLPVQSVSYPHHLHTTTASFPTRFPLILLPLTPETSHIPFFQVHMNNNLLLHPFTMKNKESSGRFSLLFCDLVIFLFCDLSNSRCSNLVCLLSIIVWWELKFSKKRFCASIRFSLNAKV